MFVRCTDIAAARGDVLADSGAVSGLDSPNNPTSKRRRFDVASGDPSNIMSRSYGSLGSIPFAQGDASHNAYGNLAAPGGAFGTGAPIQQPFAMSSAADVAEAMASGPLSQRGSLQQRTRSLSLTKERMELMRVRCGVNGTHPMRAAVKAAYRTIVARYAAPGRLPMHEITRVLEKVLEKEETVLRSLWEAQVERQGPGAAGEALKLESAANDASTETDVLLSKLAAATATPIGMGTGLHHRSDRGLRLSEGATSWGPGGEEQAFYEASSEHMIATLVSARAEMMRLLQELPLKVRDMVREILKLVGDVPGRASNLQKHSISPVVICWQCDHVIHHSARPRKSQLCSLPLELHTLFEALSEQKFCAGTIRRRLCSSSI